MHVAAHVRKPGVQRETTYLRALLKLGLQLGDCIDLCVDIYASMASRPAVISSVVALAVSFACSRRGANHASVTQKRGQRHVREVEEGTRTVGFALVDEPPHGRVVHDGRNITGLVPEPGLQVQVQVPIDAVRS